MIYLTTIFLDFMSKLGTLKQIFELMIIKRKFYMFPIIVILIGMIVVTVLSQTGLITLIYPI
jgi:hypothetical protein